MSEKLKIVWICHFSNKEIRDVLPLSNKKTLNFLKSILGKEKIANYVDFAPWVTNLIREFEKFDDIELHIISPFRGLKRLTYESDKNGVFYHFYKPDLPLIHAELPDKFHWGGKPRFLQSRFLVKKFMNKIKPDIVNLIGTENPYYSVTILDVNNIPVYISAQTVYTNPDRKKYSDSCIDLNWDIELKIHQKEKYYGVSGRMHKDLILNNNKDAIFFKMFFPIEKPKVVKLEDKIYDFVFFAGIAKKKGVEDLITALAIVKKFKSNVLLNIVGTCSEQYMSLLVNMIADFGLEKNIIFTNYFQNHADLHQHIIKSHNAVLPVMLDIIPSTVIEAMWLNLPTVTYKTSGTPYLNKDGECVLISEIGNIDMLANNMIKLIENPEYGIKLKENARAFVEKSFDNTILAKNLVKNYRSVIAHFHSQTPIPEEQLFNDNEFPNY